MQIRSQRSPNINPAGRLKIVQHRHCHNFTFYRIRPQKIIRKHRYAISCAKRQRKKSFSMSNRPFNRFCCNQRIFRGPYDYIIGFKSRFPLVKISANIHGHLLQHQDIHMSCYSLGRIFERPHFRPITAFGYDQQPFPAPQPYPVADNNLCSFLYVHFFITLT